MWRWSSRDVPLSWPSEWYSMGILALDAEGRFLAPHTRQLTFRTTPSSRPSSSSRAATATSHPNSNKPASSQATLTAFGFVRGNAPLGGAERGDAHVEVRTTGANELDGDSALDLTDTEDGEGDSDPDGSRQLGSLAIAAAHDTFGSRRGPRDERSSAELFGDSFAVTEEELREVEQAAKRKLHQRDSSGLFGDSLHLTEEEWGQVEVEATQAWEDQSLEAKRKAWGRGRA